MSNTPTVSIIIPAYNSGLFIHIILDSLIAQTCKNFEVIVVNDGSADNTGAVVEGYICSSPLNLRLITQENAGVSTARNVGLDNAQGEFCIFIDSDDYVEPHFLEKLLCKQEETSADVVYCGCNQGGRNSVKPQPATFQEGNLLRQRIQREVLFHLGGVLIRRSFLIRENIRFNTELALGEDLLFTYTILAKQHLHAVPEYLYHQTYRENSVMNSAWSKKDYEHNARAMDVIYSTMITLCHDSQKEVIAPLLKYMAIAAKIKFLWGLLQSKQFNPVIAYLDEKFLELSPIEIKALKSKERKKYKVIMSKNKMVWTLYFLFRKKKF